MAAPMLTPDPSGVAGPAPGAVPGPDPAAPPPPAPTGMPQMPGVPPLPATHAVGPKGPNFDPTGTVPVAGSPADPNHPAQNPAAAAPAPPATAEDAAARRYAADQKVADIDDKLAENADQAAKDDETGRAKKAELAKQQLAETAAEDARQKAGMDRAVAERDQLRANVRNFKFHNFWDTRTTGQSILAGIGIILGSASYSKEHQNEAVRMIDNAISQEWDQQKAELDKEFREAQEKGEDVRDLEHRYAIDSGKMKLRQEQQLTALANEMDALSARSKNQAGVLAAQKIAAEARALAEQHGEQGVKDIAAAHSQQLKDLETQAQTALANAKAGKAARRGGGGGAGGDVGGLNDWLDAHPGASAGDQARAAKQFGIKVFGKPSETTLKSVLAQREITKKDTDKAAGAAAKQSAANDKDTVRVGGVPLGLVPSGRGGAVAYGKLLEGYKDSIESVKDLLSWVEAHPVESKLLGTKSDKFHRAVLALQATSTANATDTTTKHEAESLRSLGFLNPGAIRTTLEHLQERDKAYKADLRPLPGAKGAGGFANGPAAGPVEGSTSVDSKGRPVVFRGGKWGPA